MSSIQQELVALDNLGKSNLTVRTSTISVPADKLNKVSRFDICVSEVCRVSPFKFNQ